MADRVVQRFIRGFVRGNIRFEQAAWRALKIDQGFQCNDDNE